MKPRIDASVLLRQGFRFVVAGLVNTIASYLFYLILLNWLGHQIAYALAFAFGVGVSFVLNTNFVFRAKSTLRRGALFPLVYLVQWVLGALMLEWLIASLGVDRRLAPLLVIIATIPVTFVLTRLVMTRE